jgi:transposase
VLPQNRRGVPRVDDRRVLNGIFWVLRSGAPWADLPERYSPVTTCYNRFRRWTKANIRDQIMDAITEAYGDDIKMIDGTSVRVHHSAATVKKATRIVVWGEAGAVLRRKSMAQVHGRGLPVQLTISPGQTHDDKAGESLLSAIGGGEMLLADKACDADWIRKTLYAAGAWVNIRARSNRNDPVCFSPKVYRKHNLIERFFNKLKYFRRIASRYDKLGSSYLAMIKLAAIRIRLRSYESTA